jgi:hypothetical protein
MPLTLAELKGLAVTRMNAEPVIPLKTGHILPRNFVIDTDHRWGFPALRFDDSVYLLSIPSLPAGVDDTLTGQQVFAVTHLIGADPVRRPLLGQPVDPLALSGLFNDAVEAVETAASTRSGQEFVRMALAGEFESSTKREAPPPRRRPAIADLGEFDRSLYDSNEPAPPDATRVRALMDVFRKLHGDTPENARRLNKLALRPGESLLGTDAWIIGDGFQVFHLPEVPGAAFDEEGEQPEHALAYPAIVVAKLNRHERELALGRAFPSLPILRGWPCAIRLNWGEALMRAALEWLLDEHHRELQEHLGREAR